MFDDFVIIQGHREINDDGADMRAYNKFRKKKRALIDSIEKPSSIVGYEFINRIKQDMHASLRNR